MRKMLENKKGFTLTELLATIVILALVVLIATPAVIGVSNSIKKNQYEAKVKLLLQAAKLYGEDNGAGDGDITVQDLIDGKYVTCDGNAPAGTCIVNPKNNGNMNGCEITISVHTSGRVSTSWDDASNTSDACKRD